MNTYYPNPVSILANALGIPPQYVAIVFGIGIIWTITWKGFALWRAARNQQFWWFFFMLIINDLGILEIMYLLWFRADKRGVAPEVQA